jgi:hypothetical protein
MRKLDFETKDQAILDILESALVIDEPPIEQTVSKKYLMGCMKEGTQTAKRTCVPSWESLTRSTVGNQAGLVQAID